MGSCLGRTLPCLPQQLPPETTKCCNFWRHATDEQENDLISSKSHDEEYQHKNFIFRIIKYKGRRKSAQFLERFLERQRGKYAKLCNPVHADSLTDIQMQNLDVNRLLSSPAFTKESNINYNSLPEQTGSRASSSLDLEWEHEYRQTPKMPNELIENAIESQLLHAADTAMLDGKSMADFDDADSVGHIVEAERTLVGRRLVRVYAACKKASFSRTSSHASWSYNSTPESLEWDIDEDQQRQLYEEDDGLDHETLKLLHQIEQFKNQVLNETGDVFTANEGGMVYSNAAAHDALNPVRSDILNIS